MNTFISDLLTLQQILQRGDKSRAEVKAQISRLEQAIPPPLLAHLFRQLACDRRGVALVRNRVCSACHIKLSSATLDNLSRTTDVLLCENCGCYLALPAEEAGPPQEPVLVPPPAPRRRGRRKLAVAVA